MKNDIIIEPGKLYFYIDSDLKPVRGSLFKATKVYNCEFTGIEMVGGLEVSQTGFIIINEGIPSFCIMEECPV